MRRLAQPEVLKSAVIAALITTLLCLPRILLWTPRRYPVWYLEAVLFLGGIVLWAFVFAWHAEYMQRPVFTLRISSRLFAAATAAGIVAAIVLRLFSDPVLRPRTPEEYPASVEQWFAMTLFSVIFSQLFLVFAPLAWVARLSRNPRAAIALTILFGVVVLALKARTAAAGVPGPLFAMMVAGRIVMGGLTVLFYLRGGALLAWWWGFVIEARHLTALQPA